MSGSDKLDAFQVPLRVHWLSSFVHRHPNWWVRLGNLESHTLRDQVERIEIDRPIYVTGIARAGTTIVLELLSRHPDLATHKYRDFPGQFVPVWWNKGQGKQEFVPQERAHGDRLQVTQDSPEAMEEPLWMAFFDQAHRSDVSNVLDRSTENPRFEQFYRDHLRKLMMVRQRPRYLAKGNYNLTRLAYLQQLVPSSRFVVVVRNPRDHIASLIKQHRLFCAGQQKFPRALAHLQHVGHFEFGLDRRAVCVGDSVAQEVKGLWQQGHEVRGTARYWASIYGWLLGQLAGDSELADSTLLLRYEDLCLDTPAEVAKLTTHCQLKSSRAVNQFAQQISPPSYYRPDFTDEEEAAIAEETATVAAQLGYGTQPTGKDGQATDEADFSGCPTLTANEGGVVGGGVDTSGRFVD